MFVKDAGGPGEFDVYNIWQVHNQFMSSSQAIRVSINMDLTVATYSFKTLTNITG